MYGFLSFQGLHDSLTGCTVGLQKFNLTSAQIVKENMWARLQTKFSLQCQNLHQAKSILFTLSAFINEHTENWSKIKLNDKS